MTGAPVGVEQREVVSVISPSSKHRVTPAWPLAFASPIISAQHRRSSTRGRGPNHASFRMPRSLRPDQGSDHDWPWRRQGACPETAAGVGLRQFDEGAAELKEGAVGPRDVGHDRACGKIFHVDDRRLVRLLPADPIDRAGDRLDADRHRFSSRPRLPSSLICVQVSDEGDAKCSSKRNAGKVARHRRPTPGNVERREQRNVRQFGNACGSHGRGRSVVVGPASSHTMRLAATVTTGLKKASTTAQGRATPPAVLVDCGREALFSHCSRAIDF